MATAQAQPRGEVWSLGSRIDTKREYESVTILRPDTNKQQITDLIQRMQKTFAEYGSTLVKIDSWGMRVLAIRSTSTARASTSTGATSVAPTSSPSTSA
jgi:hypothetical protein